MWAVASPAMRPLLTGLEEADSWACDGHKRLNTPYDCGIALCARPGPFRQAVGFSADYLNTTERVGRDPMDHRVEISQRARVLTLWSVLHHLGRNRIAAMIEKTAKPPATSHTSSLARRTLDLLTPVTLNQVLLRIGDAHTTLRAVDTLNASGTCWVTPTTWAGQAAVRISVTDWQSGQESADHRGSVPPRPPRPGAHPGTAL
ncbi:pyridoxal-dependent decarboxylase [Streptomyces erythrochromogenes]|uniref:pyridoxal-dependent decarboxylase n=1 Tax=Streptomyces erythrochromogenes TaxID=285574 RepID=UPI0037FAE6E5